MTSYFNFIFKKKDDFYKGKEKIVLEKMITMFDLQVEAVVIDEYLYKYYENKNCILKE